MKNKSSYFRDWSSTLNAMRTAWKFAALVILFAITGCATGPELFGEGALVVNTPVYRANRVFYLEPRQVSSDEGGGQLYYDLVDPVVISYRPRTTTVAEPVENGEPVTVVINKAYIPSDTAKGKLDKTRDIAVLIDLGFQPGKQEFIAVWYQRDVPVNEELSFSSIPVYSLDAWNSDAPPRFRVRLVDVTAERNTRTAEMLTLASQISGSVISLVGTPASGMAVEIATHAARLVLANQKNTNLVDYEFYFFSEGQLAEAGGAPLALFRKGAMVITGRPRGQDESFWSQPLQYDHEQKRLQHYNSEGPGKRVESPYVLASVLTAEALISNLVKQRSAYITKILTDSAPAVQADLAGLKRNAEELLKSLQVLETRQDFRDFPTLNGFEVFLNTTKTNENDIPKAERNFLLFSIRNSTGVIRANAAEYFNWWNKCKQHYTIDPNTKKIVEKDDGKTPPECK
jgi:hypothetical protein